MIFRFGLHEFDLDNQVLWRDGIAIKLNDDYLKILLLLAKANGHSVSNGVLAKSLGIGKHEAVRFRVRRLRSKLDDPDMQFLTTVSGGYKLIGELVQDNNEEKNLADFLTFFGAGAENSVHMIFAYRRLAEGVQISVMESRLVEKRLKGKNGPNGEIPQPEGVHAWLPGEDVRAAVYVSNLISNVLKAPKFTFHDDDFADAGNSGLIMSFGLFNDYTWHLADICPGNLFKMDYGFSPRIKHYFTDSVVFNGESVPLPVNRDIGIIARVVIPMAGDGRPSIRFLIGGRTAPGTAAAGHYLSTNWKRLLKYYSEFGYDPNEHSMAAIIAHKWTGRDDQRVDETAVLLLDEQLKPKIEFAKYE